MARDDKTEQATPRRRQKAREKGRVARSRELSGALVSFAGVLVLLWVSAAELQRWRGSWRSLPEFAARADFSSTMPALTWTGVAAVRWMIRPFRMLWQLAADNNVEQEGLVYTDEVLLQNAEHISP